MNVLVAGHICADLTVSMLDRSLPRPGELLPAGELSLSVGGSVGNTGMALAALEIDVRVEACVGDDDLGDLVETKLQRSGLPMDVALRRVETSGTSYSVVLDGAGVDRSFWHYSGANDAFDGVSNHAASMAHLGYPTALSGLVGDDGSDLARLFVGLKSRGITTSVDLSSPTDDGLRSRDWSAILELILPFVDIVSPSLADLRILVPALRAATAIEGACWLVARGAAVALVTDGAHGAAIRTAAVDRAATAGTALEPVRFADFSDVVPARATTAIRTTGAGDVATAGLLAAIVNRSPVEDWARAAMEVAARHVRGEAISGIIAR